MDNRTRLIKYNSLIIATGSRAKTLEETGVDSGGYANVVSIRKASDIGHLRRVISERAPRKKSSVSTLSSTKANKDIPACVIGGGYIGLESASYLHGWGFNVTVIHSGKQLLTRFLPPEVGFRYTQLYRKSNVTVILEETPVGVLGGFNATGILMSDGTTINCSLVVSAVGAVPNTDLFQNQLNLTSDGGIKTDNELQTGIPGVYAVGDVVAFPWDFYNGTHKRWPFGDHARRSGEHVARIILYRPHHLLEEIKVDQYLNKTASMIANKTTYRYIPKTTFDSLLGPRKKIDANTIVESRFIKPAHGEFYGYMIGRVIYFNCIRNRFKFGAFWVHNGKAVGTYMEGGLNKDFRLMKKVAEMQLPVQEIEYEHMEKDGLGWARETLDRELDASVYPGFSIKDSFFHSDLSPRQTDIDKYDASETFIEEDTAFERSGYSGVGSADYSDVMDIARL